MWRALFLLALSAVCDPRTTEASAPHSPTDDRIRWTTVDGDSWATPTTTSGVIMHANANGAVWASLDGEPLFRMKTNAIGRDRITLVDAPTSIRTDGDELSLVRPVAIERLRATPGRIEHEWTISNRPNGVGRVQLELLADRRWELPPEDRHTAWLRLDESRSIGYANLRVFDRTGTRLPAFFTADDRSLVIVIDDADASYPITIDPTFLFTFLDVVGGRQNDERFGHAVCTAGDVNGDGYSDFLATAPSFDPGGHPHAGRVDMFWGHSPVFLPPISDWSFAGNAGDGVGADASTAGDVNGDGYDDVIVGADGIDAAYLWLGGPVAPSSVPNWVYSAPGIGDVVAYAGDLDADGFADVALTRSAVGGVPAAVLVFYGSSAGLGSSPDLELIDPATSDFGRGLSTAGDIDADGFDDLVVGAPDLLGVGGVFVFRGGAAGLTSAVFWSATGATTGEHFGAAVAMAGDVNGDGYSDIVVGAPDHGPQAEGRFVLYAGHPHEPTSIGDTAGTVASARLGRDVSTAGDMNGDGYADVLVAMDAPQPGAPGARLVLGDRNGLGAHIEYPVGPGPHSVSTAGDFDNDGMSDPLVGSPLMADFQGVRGFVHVFEGSATAPEASPGWSATPLRVDAAFASALAAAGDVNGDGHMDLIVGAPDAEASRGLVVAYYGTSTGLSSTPRWSATGLDIGERFGAALSTVGDVNGDGYWDIAVGAPGSAAVAGFTGGVDVFVGSAGGLLSERVRVRGEQVGSNFGAAVGYAGDVNGDGLDDLLIGAPTYGDPGHPERGRAYVATSRGGRLRIDWATSGRDAYDHYGFAVAGVGDQNRDGLADVAIGAPRRERAGRVYVYQGTMAVAAGAPLGVLNTPTWTLDGSHPDDRFGHAISGPGNWDKRGIDRWDDFIVLAPSEPTTPLQLPTFVWLASGGNTGPQLTSILTVQGCDFMATGDMNLDGFDDLALSTPTGTLLLSAQKAASSILIPLATALPVPTPGTSLPIAGVGDTDGDGFWDLAVGVPSHTENGQVVGQVHLHRGSDGGARPRLLRSRRIDNSAPLGPMSWTDYATGFRYDFDVFSPAGRRRTSVLSDVRPIPWTPRSDVVSIPVETGVPVAGTGSLSRTTVLAEVPAPGATYTWRTRVETDHPYFPTTPWRWPHLRSMMAPRVRTSAP